MKSQELKSWRQHTSRGTYWAALFLLLSFPRLVLAATPVTLTVTPGTAASQLGDPSLLRSLAMGGFTPAYKATPAVLEALSTGGEQRMRLINVEWGTKVRIQPNGTLHIRWSHKLEHELAECRKYGFIPHIVIGQTDPAAVTGWQRNGHVIGVDSWPRYRAYVRAMIRHVVVDWGFADSEWEVGNEMDNPKFNWVDVNGMNGRLDPAGYHAYLKLYSAISDVFAKAKKQFPTDTILLGGPALTQNSMNYPLDSKRNWIMRFSHDVTAEKLVCDFISMHGYGSAFSRPSLLERVNAMRQAMDADGRIMPIWFTEWGANAFYTRAPVNFSPVAGAYSLSFIDALAQSGVSGALFIAAQRKPGAYGPALFNADGTPADAYRALQYIMTLHGTRVGCTTNDSKVGCLAVKDGSKATILLWYLDWQRRAMGTKEGSGPTLPVQIKVKGPGHYVLSNINLDGRAVAKSFSSGESTGGVLGTIDLPYGSYAKLELQQ